MVLKDPLSLTLCPSFPGHRSFRLTWIWLAPEDSGSSRLSACPSLGFSDIQRLFSFLWVCIWALLTRTVPRHQGICSLELSLALYQRWTVGLPPLSGEPTFLRLSHGAQPYFTTPFQELAMSFQKTFVIFGTKWLLSCASPLLHPVVTLWLGVWCPNSAAFMAFGYLCGLHRLIMSKWLR